MYVRSGLELRVRGPSGKLTEDHPRQLLTVSRTSLHVPIDIVESGSSFPS